MPTCRKHVPALALALAVVGSFGCAGGAPVVGGPFPGNAASETYLLGGTKVTLKDGTFVEKTGDGPDDLVATDLTGTKLDADLDGDGSTDQAVVLTRDEGPLKMHYLAVLSNKGPGSIQIATLPLGQNVLVEELRLAPKSGLFVKLLKHDEGSPLDAPPTLRVTERYVVKAGHIEKAPD